MLLYKFYLTDNSTELDEDESNSNEPDEDFAGVATDEDDDKIEENSQNEFGM